MNNPRIRIKMSLFDLIGDIISVGLILTAWIMIVFLWRNLPATIPSHYDMAGNIDGYSSKASILLLPAIMTLAFIGMKIVEFFPGSWNMSVKVTRQNAAKVYRKSKDVLTMSKMTISTVFFVIFTFAISLKPMPWYVSVGLILLPFILIIVMIIRLSINNN